MGHNILFPIIITLSSGNSKDESWKKITNFVSQSSAKF